MTMPARIVLACVLTLLACAAAAPANMTPPWWDRVRTRNILDPGRFAYRAGLDVPGGGYRFYVRVRGGYRRVMPKGRFELDEEFPLALVAVPIAHDAAWRALVASHDYKRDGSLWDIAEKAIPGFARQYLPRRSVVPARVSAVRTMDAYFRVHYVAGGAIDYTITDVWRDVDEWPGRRVPPGLLAISAIGAIGLGVTTACRRRATRPAGSPDPR
jgi:hypothetical protein